jgi:hypothetical protein
MMMGSSKKGCVFDWFRMKPVSITNISSLMPQNLSISLFSHSFWIMVIMLWESWHFKTLIGDLTCLFQGHTCNIKGFLCPFYQYSESLVTVFQVFYLGIKN